jgi:hypothetical protein
MRRRRATLQKEMSPFAPSIVTGGMRFYRAASEAADRNPAW